jgi:hypothetical protein
MHSKQTAIFLNEVNEGKKLWDGMLNFLCSLMFTTMLQHVISHGFHAVLHYLVHGRQLLFMIL